MANIFKKLFDNEYKELKRFNAIATKIDALDEDMSKLSDKKLANKIMRKAQSNYKNKMYITVKFQSSKN